MFDNQRAREFALSQAYMTETYKSVPGSPDKIIKTAEAYLSFLQGVQHQPSGVTVSAQAKVKQKATRSSSRKR